MGSILCIPQISKTGMRNRRVSNRELSDVRIQDVQRGVRIMEREMKRKPRVKKACSILLALLLVLTLMPSQVAFAEDGHYKNGDICPDCGNVLTVEKASASRHSVHCGFCGYRSYEEHWGFDDHCLCAGCEQICHDYTAYYADKDPTCTELGVICHWYCSRCQKTMALEKQSFQMEHGSSRRWGMTSYTMTRRLQLARNTVGTPTIPAPAANTPPTRRSRPRVTTGPPP